MFFLFDGQKFNSHGSSNALQSETDDVEIIGVKQRKTEWKISFDFLICFHLEDDDVALGVGIKFKVVESKKKMFR